MVVISDTSCLVALTNIGALDILPQTFGEVNVPSAVYRELLLLKDFGIDVQVFSVP